MAEHPIGQIVMYPTSRRTSRPDMWDLREVDTQHGGEFFAGNFIPGRYARLYAVSPDLFAAAVAVLALLGPSDLPDNGELSGAAVTDQLRAAVAAVQGR